MCAQRGFTLIETMVSALIIGIALLGIASFFSNGTAYLSDMKERAVAAYAVQEQLEVIRGMSFDAIVSTYFPSQVFTASGFVNLNSATGTITVDYPFGSASPQNNIIRVTATVRWMAQAGVWRTKAAATMITRDGISG